MVRDGHVRLVNGRHFRGVFRYFNHQVCRFQLSLNLKLNDNELFVQLKVGLSKVLVTTAGSCNQDITRSCLELTNKKAIGELLESQLNPQEAFVR